MTACTIRHVDARTRKVLCGPLGMRETVYEEAGSHP